MMWFKTQPPSLKSSLIFKISFYIFLKNHQRLQTTPDGFTWSDFKTVAINLQNRPTLPGQQNHAVYINALVVCSVCCRLLCTYLCLLYLKILWCYFWLNVFLYLLFQFYITYWVNLWCYRQPTIKTVDVLRVYPNLVVVCEIHCPTHW